MKIVETGEQTVMWTHPDQIIWTRLGWASVIDVNNDFIGATYVRTAEFGWLKFIAHDKISFVKNMEN